MFRLYLLLSHTFVLKETNFCIECIHETLQTQIHFLQMDKSNSLSKMEQGRMITKKISAFLTTSNWLCCLQHRSDVQFACCTHVKWRLLQILADIQTEIKSQWFPSWAVTFFNNTKPWRWLSPLFCCHTRNYAVGRLVIVWPSQEPKLCEFVWNGGDCTCAQIQASRPQCKRTLTFPSKSACYVNLLKPFCQ